MSPMEIVIAYLLIGGLFFYVLSAQFVFWWSALASSVWPITGLVFIYATLHDWFNKYLTPLFDQNLFLGILVTIAILNGILEIGVFLVALVSMVVSP